MSVAYATLIFQEERQVYFYSISQYLKENGILKTFINISKKSFRWILR